MAADPGGGIIREAASGMVERARLVPLALGPDHDIGVGADGYVPLRRRDCGFQLNILDIGERESRPISDRLEAKDPPKPREVLP